MVLAALYEQIDPDALDALLDRRWRLVESGDLTVSFSYERHEVTVTSDGEVIVEPQQEAAYLVALAFVDTAGGEGRIDEDLNVTHVGDDGVTESVEAFVEEIVDEAESVGEVFDTLLVELPDACAIREIRPIRGTPEQD